MNSSSSNVFSILDLPDEILAKIILHFNVKERLTLANSCERFYGLVFGDKELLRYLDFSEAWYLTSKVDIHKYFIHKSTYIQILKVNMKNVKCLKRGRMLVNSIGKAINIVDLNIRGISFRNIDELAELLRPLIHLKRLAVNWPCSRHDVLQCVVIYNKNTQNLLNRLTYLEVELSEYPMLFLSKLKLCYKLEELRLVTRSADSFCLGQFPFSERFENLRNLRIVQFCEQEILNSLKDVLMSMIPHPYKWTDFHLLKPHREGYLEKSVQVCDKLYKIKVKPMSENIYNLPGFYDGEIGWNLSSEQLLREVIAINHQDVPEKFCCLDEYKDVGFQACVIKIDEAKQLLKDPEYQISYLHFKHSIEPDCDAHLVVSAFPNLTELVLARISKEKDTMSALRTTKHFQSRLRRRGSAAFMEDDDPKNPDSSFKMLVENTPHLKGLTIFSLNAFWYEHALEQWDLDALYLISKWKNLTAIRLRDIPITNGKFLIEIGRECTKLEQLLLFRLGPSDFCCYASDLLQMIKHCKNLRKFSICQNNIKNMSEIFATLSNNSKLRTVRLITSTESWDSVDLAASIEQMLHRCSHLTKFVFMVNSASDRVHKNLRPSLRRIVNELKRPDFEFHGPVHSGSSSAYEEPPTSFFGSPLDDHHFAKYNP